MKGDDAPAVIDDGDDDVPAVAHGFVFARGEELFGVVERERGFVDHLRYLSRVAGSSA